MRLSTDEVMLAHTKNFLEGPRNSVMNFKIVVYNKPSFNIVGVVFQTSTSCETALSESIFARTNVRHNVGCVPRPFSPPPPPRITCVTL
jgi:hypothetical protein